MKQGIPNPTEQKRGVEPECVSVADAEAMTGLSRWTWRRYAYDGKIASVKVGSRLLIPITEVRRVLAAGYRPALASDEGKAV